MTATYVQFDPRPHVQPPLTPAGPSNVVPLFAPGTKTAQPQRAVVDTGLPRERVEAALARVLSSATFRQSKRHRDFLRYVVDGTLAGRAQAIKEVVIGIDVFDRSVTAFDPRRDPIVRVEARRLRDKLGKYYETEGKDDAIAITIATGRYVPTFVDRSALRVPADAPLLMVLPLRTAGDVGLRGWSIGLADQLVARLGTLGRVRVMAPSAATTRHDPALLDTLCRDHGVGFVIDGSIAQAGSRLRCTMFLARTSDHVCLWSQTAEFGVTMADDDSDILFRIQDRVADAVADAVRDRVVTH